MTKRKTISLPWEMGAGGGALPLPAVTARAAHSPFPTPQNGCGGAIPEGTRRGGTAPAGLRSPGTRCHGGAARHPSVRGQSSPRPAPRVQPAFCPRAPRSYRRPPSSLPPAKRRAAAGPTAGRGAAAAAPSLTAHGGTTRTLPLRGNAPPARRPR